MNAKLSHNEQYGKVTLPVSPKTAFFVEGQSVQLDIDGAYYIDTDSVYLNPVLAQHRIFKKYGDKDYIQDHLDEFTDCNDFDQEFYEYEEQLEDFRDISYCPQCGAIFGNFCSQCGYSEVKRIVLSDYERKVFNSNYARKLLNTKIPDPSLWIILFATIMVGVMITVSILKALGVELQ